MWWLGTQRNFNSTKQDRGAPIDSRNKNEE